MKKTTAFLYRWTEISSSKWYEGSRTARGCHPADGYICSSKEVKPLILETPGNWTRKILVVGEPMYIRELEHTRLASLDAKNDPMSYNKHNGDGKFSMTGKTGGRKGKAPWNKGLTKIDSASIKGGTRKGSKPWNAGKTGIVTWNKGLTKESDSRVAQYAAKNSGISKPGVVHIQENKELFRQQKTGDKNPMYGKAPANKGVTGKYTMSEQSNAARSAAAKCMWAKRKQISAGIVLVENNAEKHKI